MLFFGGGGEDAVLYPDSMNPHILNRRINSTDEKLEHRKCQYFNLVKKIKINIQNQSKELPTISESISS